MSRNHFQQAHRYNLGSSAERMLFNGYSVLPTMEILRVRPPSEVHKMFWSKHFESVQVRINSFPAEFAFCDFTLTNSL